MDSTSVSMGAMAPQSFGAQTLGAAQPQAQAVQGHGPTGVAAGDQEFQAKVLAETGIGGNLDVSV
mgnify:CR=1 FL=1